MTPSSQGFSSGARDVMASLGTTSFLFSCLLRHFPGYLRNDTDSGISYPNQHIDSDCFFADLSVFELAAHDTHSTIMSSSDMDCPAPAFCQKACFTNILRTRSYAKHAAWGAIDLASAFSLRTTSIFFYFTTKSDSFPWLRPLMTSLFGNLLVSSPSADVKDLFAAYSGT